jgi:trimethylamine:corrinoid methyltransferase-like protein
MSFDDIFSPEQMVADCELRDALQQLARGIPCDGPDDWLDVIREGATGGYVDTDTTLDRYGETYWFPELYDRLSWHVFRAENGRTARQRARQEVLGRIAAYAYEPPDEIGTVRRIFDAAWMRLGGDPASPILDLLTNE